MTRRFGMTLGGAVFAAALVLQPVASVASGEPGEHVEDLKGHLDEYEQEVNEFNKRADDMVSRYEADGADGVDTGELVDFWEEVKFHGALEQNYVPVYAAVWQGIYGVKEGIDEGESADDVRAEQQALAQALWQGLGAVKLAARNQAEGDGKEQASEDESGSSVVERIIANLEEVTVETAEGHREEASELVHDTYMDLFEGIEGALIEQDAELVESLEKDFNVTLPELLEKEASVSKVTDQVDAMTEKLERAGELLEKSQKDEGEVF